MVKLQLPRLLGERRMSQAELSRLTGIRPNTINDLYHDMADRVSFEHLDRICEVLDCPLSDLIVHYPNKVPKTGRAPIIEQHQACKRKSISEGKKI